MSVAVTRGTEILSYLVGVSSSVIVIAIVRKNISKVVKEKNESIKSVIKEKKKDPSSVLPWNIVILPYLIPIIAAKESDNIVINIAIITEISGKNKAITVNPIIIYVEPIKLFFS